MGYSVVRKTNFHKASTHKEWFSWCKSLTDLYQTEKYFVVNNLENVSYLQMRKWILGHKFEGVDKMLRNLVLDAMLSADNKCMGSEVYVPWFLWNETVLIPERSSSKVYLDATLSRSKSEEAKDLFKLIWDTVGPTTKIIIKKSAGHETILKYRNAYTFPLGLDPQFHRIIGHQSSIEQANPIVIMIEGAPETLGEIDPLLRWQHESGRPVILIARSFPEEISATLATNWLRGSLNILPIPYGNSIESINLSADMCAITKGELISAHFGDIISASILNEDKWGSVTRSEWAAGKLSLYSEANVDVHKRNLVEKMKQQDNEELQKIYSDRILSLSNDAIEVWIPRDNSRLELELDGLIKHYNGFVISGIVKTPIGNIPYNFATTAKESAGSLRKEILNIGGFLVGVEDEVVAGRRR